MINGENETVAKYQKNDASARVWRGVGMAIMAISSIGSSAEGNQNGGGSVSNIEMAAANRRAGVRRQNGASNWHRKQ